MPIKVFQKNEIRIIFAVYIIVVFVTLISLTWLINQPKYTPINDFDRNNLEPYKEGDILYIKDFAESVTFQQSNSLSMFDAYIYEVRTRGGYVFEVETYNEHERPNIRPGTPLILIIEIFWSQYTEDYGVMRYGVIGYTETEFILSYNYNWLIIFIEGTSMFLSILIILFGYKIKKLNWRKKILFSSSIGLLVVSAFFLYMMSYSNVMGGECCLAIVSILFVVSMLLLYLSLRKNPNNDEKCPPELKQSLRPLQAGRSNKNKKK